jgi:hypothetical protein
MNVHEHHFVEAFIAPARRDRYLTMLPNPKRRRKITDRLNHCLLSDLGPGVAVGRSPHANVAQLLRSRGASATCHIIADSFEMDGQELALDEAVDLAKLYPFGIVLCCILGRLACYRPESPAPFYLLEAR